MRPDRRPAHGRLSRLLGEGAVQPGAGLRAKLIITADGGYRRGAASALKPAVDEAVAKVEAEQPDLVENVLVVKRTGQEVAWNGDIDIWWHDLVDESSEIHEPEFFDSEHPLYTLANPTVMTLISSSDAIAPSED